MITRRRMLLGGAAATAAAGVLIAPGLRGEAADDDYRALVVLFLMGGSDGHNMLIPLDGMYNDYQVARVNLALAKTSLAPLPGTAAGHMLGLHPALTPLVPLYAERRLSFIANAGPLVQPTTAVQARTNAVDMPPFLFSHSDQVAIQQGWTVREDSSGWAGRTLELLPSSLRNPLAAVTMDNRKTLVLGKRSPVSFMDRNGARYWGPADLANPKTEAAQAINRMAQWQFANAYEAEYARSFGYAVSDATRITEAMLSAKTPTADFGANELGLRLKALASVLPQFRSQGLRRQVFLVSWGSFDTHTNQLGTDANTQDSQFAVMAQALTAFDATNRANGLDMNVLTLMMSDFGRTVRPGSGGGSEHAWGNHWFALGGPVAGGNVVGTFPSPVLGGPDDGDLGNNGRHVPTTSTDQVGATAATWLGLPSSALHEAFPDLVNFPQKTLPLLRA